ncbi:DUF4214 domain-containing protein [Salipiger mangrovisoli]|uniref:DUF4214 domain-containing protein n=1 Tax=Salipiger mangrovisoli TaxID=2865933 RepID=UPI0030B82870
MFFVADGRDTLLGAEGRDWLVGEAGDDVLIGESLPHASGATGAQVYRLYSATLGRPPDSAGFTSWTARLDAGQSLRAILPGFVRSAGFQKTFGALDDRAFVTLLYHNVLERAPDRPGLNAWAGRLGNGMSRAEVVEGFAQSREFTQKTAAPFRAFMRDFEGDTLAGGAGEDLLLGSFRADRFVFDAAQAGRDRVLRIDPWDTIDLRGFGYGNAVAAPAQFSEVGPDTVFSDGDVSVVFAISGLKTLADTAFLL